MRLVKRDPEMDLTQEEIDILKSSGIPDDVKRYLSRQHENIGLKISAYRKVAEAASAEREAIIAVRSLEMLKDNAESVGSYRDQINGLKETIGELRRAGEDQDRRIRQMTALPAMVVNGEPTGR